MQHTEIYSTISGLADALSAKGRGRPSIRLTIESHSRYSAGIFYYNENDLKSLFLHNETLTGLMAELETYVRDLLGDEIPF
jgi:hypothetical protein